MAFDRTIPRGLVHKAGPEAVWLSEIEQISADVYRCVGQVPRAHSFVNDALEPRYTYYDLGLLAEFGRQAGISTMHEFEDVPLNAPTVFLKFDLSVVDPQPNDRTPGPVPVVIETTYTNREREDGRVKAVSVDMTYEIDGVVRATSRSLAAAYERESYKAWRAEMKEAAPPVEIPEVAPVDPAKVGRRNPENVLVGEITYDESDSFTCPVHVDLLQPHFFEHPMDHVPGVVHLEAMRQAATIAAADRYGVPPNGVVVLECAVRFTGFAELALPTSCSGVLGEPEDAGSGHVDLPFRMTLGQPGDDSVTSARLVLRAARS